MVESLEQQLTRHEGFRLKPYLCSAGKLTIGVGRNLTDNGITESEAKVMLRNDITRFYGELQEYLPWSVSLDPARRDVLANMAFNLGTMGLFGFKNFLAAMQVKDWGLASSEMLNSRWARQVGTRAAELAKIIKNGGM